MKTTQENTMKTTQDNNPKVSTEVTNATTSAVVATNIEWIKSDVKEIKDTLVTLTSTYVTQVEFRPVKNIVFGLVGLILVSVVGALLCLVILKV